MYSGQRRILVQGAVSDGVTATCGLPLGCGHAVDMLHAFLITSLRCAGRQVEVRKYVDDMVLISSGPGFAGNLCFAYRQVLRSLTAVNMKVNALKTVVLCHGSVTKRKLWKVWRAGRLPPVQITTRGLGVDTQWFAWRNPVQQKRISSFRASMYRTRALGLPAHVKARIVKSLFSVGLYGAEAGGISDQHMKDLRASARGALGKGASLRRSAALESGANVSWRAFWRPSGPEQRQSKRSHQKLEIDSRLDFQGLASGLATQTLRQLKLDGQSQKDSVKSALNAALGGVWHEVANSVFEVGEMCVRCGEAVEDLEHIVHHCPAWASERREVELPAAALKAPPCVRLHGLLQGRLCLAMNRLWLPGLVFILCGRMVLGDAEVILTLGDVRLATTLTLGKVSFCPYLR
eukprot:1097796-Amphidinium_carterae.1